MEALLRADSVSVLLGKTIGVLPADSHTPVSRRGVRLVGLSVASDGWWVWSMAGWRRVGVG